MRLYPAGITTMILASAFDTALATDADRVSYEDLGVHSKNAYQNVINSCEDDVRLLCSPNQEVPFMSMLGFGDPFFDWILGGGSSPMYSEMYVSSSPFVSASSLSSSSSISYSYLYAPPAEMTGLDQLMDSMFSDLDGLSTSYSLRASEPSASTTTTVFLLEDLLGNERSDPFETNPRDLMDKNNNDKNNSGSDTIPSKLAHTIQDFGAESLLHPLESTTTTSTHNLLENAGIGSAEIPNLASELQNYERSSNANFLLHEDPVGSAPRVARRLTQDDSKTINIPRAELPFSCKNHCLEQALQQKMVSDQCSNAVWLLEQTMALETNAKLRAKQDSARNLLLASCGLSLVVLVALLLRSKHPGLRRRKLDQKVVGAVLNNPSIRRQVELQISESIGHYDLVDSQTTPNPKTIVLLTNRNHDDDEILAHNATISRKHYVPPQIV